MSWKLFPFSGPFLFAGALNSSEAPSPHWPLATLLIGAVSVLLLLGIKESGRRHSTNGSAAPTKEVRKSVPPPGQALTRR